MTMNEKPLKTLEMLFRNEIARCCCPFNAPLSVEDDNNPVVRCKPRRRFETWQALKAHATALAQHRNDTIRSNHEELLELLASIEEGRRS
jgi:hypothetical protein